MFQGQRKKAWSLRSKLVTYVSWKTKEILISHRKTAAIPIKKKSSNYTSMHMLFLFPNTVFLILKGCCKYEGQSGVCHLSIPKRLLVSINNQST